MSEPDTRPQGEPTPAEQCHGPDWRGPWPDYVVCPKCGKGYRAEPNR